MIISTTDDATIGAIQEKFRAQFPHLRISFYQPVDHFSVDALVHISPETNLRQLRRLAPPAYFVLTDKSLVAEVEGFFRQHFRVEAQIERQAGAHWFMTTPFTDQYTVGRQEAWGEESGRTLESPESDDIHEQQ